MTGFFTTEFMATQFNNTTTTQSAQGQLSSQYTTALTNYLSSDLVSDWIGFLAKQAGYSLAQAIEVANLVDAGSFSLSNLFGAAQSKTGAVLGANIANPEPVLTVTLADSTVVKIDLTAILTGLDTETWKQVDTINQGKKVSTVETYHTREFYTDGHQPADYSADWRDEAPPTPIHVVSDPVTVSKVNSSEGGDTFAVNFTLLGSEQDSIVLHFSGTGDYNWDHEGFTITGEALAQLMGPNSSNGTGTEPLDFVIGPATVSASDVDNDGKVELTVQFANDVLKGSELTLWIEYNYWI